MSAIALRYAEAFASVAETHKLDAQTIQQQLAGFSQTLAASSELREALENPAISAAEKLSVLDAIAARMGLMPQVRNFLAVIMDHGRMNMLHEIFDEYHSLLDERAGLAEAEITTVHPLSSPDRAALESKVAKLAGGRVRAIYREDSSLLGGVVVRIGSTIYDGSLRAQLMDLKQKLINA
ncbi:MAG: ATP synthase F1 subunit delta [Acidobacteriaceae bacterium]|nr:ATP synthase F1 subunit delta [Acidobacteriaceae bacterium]